MNNKKILSLAMATVMAISGGPILTGCSNSKGTKEDYLKELVSEQDKEDQKRLKIIIFLEVDM